MDSQPSVTSFVALVDKLRTSAWLKRSFFTEFEFPVYEELESGRVHRQDAMKNHIKGGGAFVERSLDELSKASLCRVCWDGNRFLWRMQKWDDYRLNARSELKTFVGACRLSDAFDEVAALTGVPGRTVDTLATGLNYKARLLRNMWRWMADDPWLRDGHAQLVEVVEAIDTQLKSERRHELLEWAREQLAGKEYRRFWVDETPTVLAITNVYDSHLDGTGKLLLHATKLRRADACVVAVLPRYAVDALLLHEVAVTETYVCAMPVPGVELDTIETAAGIWDPGSDGPMADFPDALEAARLLNSAKVAVVRNKVVDG